MILNVDMNTDFRKDFCMVCKRIVGQQACLITPRAIPIKIMVCPRCQEEAVEIAKMYEFVYGWKTAFAAPENKDKSIITPTEG